jgi:hypothetical protein
MSKPTKHAFTHKDVVTAMIRDRGIHEGIWGLYVHFGLSAHNINAAEVGKEVRLTPAATVALFEISLQPFEAESTISVDAAKVNPKQRVQKKR